MNELIKKAALSQEAFKSLSLTDSQYRNSMLEELANSLNDNKNQILNENNRDYSQSKLMNDKSSATLERLLLSKKKVFSQIDQTISNTFKVVSAALTIVFR